MSPASGRALAGARGLVLFVLAAAAVRGPACAAEPLAFIIPDEDGYGIAECMRGGCGQSFATAWCEAHGHLKAIAFGMADITGSTPAAAAAPSAVQIRCGD